MFSKLALFQTASALAEYSVARQTAVAQNMANSDTPGYRAKDMESFSEVFSENLPSMPLRVSRERHFPSEESFFDLALKEMEKPGDQSPNGNTVSLEEEMIKAADIQFRHDLALTVYHSGMTLLRTSLGKAR